MGLTASQDVMTPASEGGRYNALRQPRSPQFSANVSNLQKFPPFGLAPGTQKGGRDKNLT